MKNNTEEKNTFNTIREARRVIKKRMFGYIAAGLGLVAGLAWNDAIKVIIDQLIPNTSSTIIAKLIYAVVVTILVGIILFYVEKSTTK
jgi:ABC-type bacteriocin/lantibiotic exporter with double-glycine peptidase domain